MKNVHLAVLVPSMGTWRAETGASLLHLGMLLCTRAIAGAVSTHFSEGSMLPRMRQEAVEKALAAGATHLLFIDSDMVFPADIAHRLLSHGQDIVLCDYATRIPPFRGTAMLSENRDPVPDGATGLHEVVGGGLGCALVTRQVFERLERPWFAFEYLENGEWRGEDFHLFRKAREAGFKVFCDADASRAIGHVGTQVYRF